MESLNNLADIVKNLLLNVKNIILTAGYSVVILTVIFAAMRYITGDAKGGKAALTASVIGTVIVLVATWIIYILCDAGNSACTP